MRTALFAVGIAAALASASATAQDYGSPRQYYGSWKKHPTHDYQYREYYYKPAPEYRGYKHHYVIRTPKKPKHQYFYNPYKKRYWGRCPVDHGGQPMYSRLAEADQRVKLSEIPESAFPPPGELPPIPDSDDGALLDLPPDDLPAFDVDAE